METDSERRLLLAFKYPGDKDKVRNLLPLILDPRNIKDPYNQNLLHFAGDRGWLDIVEELIVKYHFDPHYEDELGGTALGDACARGHTEVARYLVNEWCVDPTKKDRNGKSPLDECTIWDRQETIDFLQSVVDEAKENNYEDVGQYLKDRVIKKAMESGGGQLSQTNITMHGAPGAGKTSVKRLIAGLPPLPKDDQNATDIMERAVRAVCTKILKDFEVIDDAELIEVLAEEIENKQVKSTVSKHQENKDSEHQLAAVPSAAPLDHAGINLEVNSFVSHRSTLHTISASSKNMKVLQRLNKALKNVKPSSSMFESLWFHLVDSGGQPQFLDILPLVYSSPSLHIVVMRLTEGLDEKPPVRYYSEGKVIYSLPNHLCLTNREMIVQSCQIASRNITTHDGFVMVIATHRDQLGVMCQSKIKELNEGLEKERQQFGNILICKSASEIVFVVNAVADGEERHLYSRELQTCIMRNAKKLIKPVDVPLKWLAFHLDLDKDEGVMKLSECIDKGKTFSMNEADVQKVLQFLNRAALILYFPNELPHLVLTKMNPFIGKLSQLVKASFNPPEFRPPGPSTRLKEHGLFNKAFLREILGDKSTERDLNEDDFLKLLLCLRIAVHVKGDEYFLPSALSLDPCPKSSFETISNPLAFTWDNCILPPGFFFTVAIELLNYSKEELSFELRTDVSQQRKEIQITAVDGVIPGVIKLTDRKSWIQVSYSDDVRYCFPVFSAVNFSIEKSAQRLHHLGVGMPKIRYLCPLCKPTKDPHYCNMTRNKDKLVCSINKLNTGGFDTKTLFCWTQDFDKAIEQEKDQSNSLPPIDNKRLSEDDILAILEVIQSVVKWQDLGLQLKLKDHELEEIRKESYSISECRLKMIRLWIKTKENASWSTLAHALNSPLVKETKVAEEISITHPT